MYEPLNIDLRDTTATGIEIDTDYGTICMTPADAIGPDEDTILAALAKIGYTMTCGWSQPDGENCVVASIAKLDDE